MSCTGSPRSDIDVRLPDAPPDSYLRWLKWVRRAERTVLRRLTERRAFRRAVREVYGPMALTWAVVASEIEEQAEAARRRGDDHVAPIVTAPPNVLSMAAEHLGGRLTWAERLGRVNTLKVKPPNWSLILLQGRVSAKIHQQLLRHAHPRPLAEMVGAEPAGLGRSGAELAVAAS